MGQAEDRVVRNSRSTLVGKMEESVWKIVAVVASNAAHLLARMRWHGSLVGSA